MEQINQDTIIKNKIKQLNHFYNDFDFTALNLSKEKIIKNSVYLVLPFEKANFNDIIQLANNKILQNIFAIDPNNKPYLTAINYNDNPDILEDILKNVIIYKYCFENEQFYNLIAFYFELVKDKIRRDKTGEPLSLDMFSDIYFRATTKDYKNNFILLFDSSQLIHYANLLKDIKHFRETGEDIENYNAKDYTLTTRQGLKEYTKDTFNLLTYFIDFENKKATFQCYNEYIPQAEQPEEEKKIKIETIEEQPKQEDKEQVKEKPQEKKTKQDIEHQKRTPFIYEQKPDRISITEHTSRDYEKSEEKKLKHIQQSYTEEEPEIIKRAKRNKKIIDNFRANNPDANLTDEQILSIKTQAEETTIFDFMKELGLEEELKKSGIDYEIYKDGQKEKTLFKSKSGTLENIMNIEDIEVYKNFGKTTLALKKYIEAQVINFFRNNSINDLTSKTEIKINPYLFNEYRHITKHITQTKEEIGEYLNLLTYNSIRIDNTKNKRGNIWKTPEDKINKNTKLDEETKKQLIKHTYELSITFNLIDHFIKIKDPETNQETYFIRLTQTYIDYLKLVYINNYFITDNTNPIKPIEAKPNDRTPERAEFIKDTILFYLKQDKSQRQQLKDSQYTTGQYITTIGKLKNLLIENNKLNTSKLKKLGYTKIIYQPITEALKYLVNNKIIELYPTSILSFLDNIRATKENQNLYEQQEINLTLLNGF